MGCALVASHPALYHDNIRYLPRRIYAFPVSLVSPALSLLFDLCG